MSPGRSRVSLRPKQSLGQNFLVDENIVRNIIREFNPQPQDVVLEIGAGKGALTAHLAAAEIRHLVIVEIDQRVIEELGRQFGGPKTTILHQDILAVDFSVLHDRFQQPLRIVGNLPYHLTSPILFKLFDQHWAVENLTIMVQREVARRLTAHPGSKDYGILAVMTQFYGVPKLLFNVSPNCFYPKPKVTSTVLKIDMHRTLPYDVYEESFRTVVRTAFGKRRKTLRNSLKYLPVEEEVLGGLLRRNDLPLDKRPEQLEIPEFVRIANVMQKMLRKS